MQPVFIRAAQLATTPKRTGRLPVSPATLWRWVKTGQFPQPCRLGPQTAAWRVADVEAWERQRTQGA